MRLPPLRLAPLGLALVFLFVSALLVPTAPAQPLPDSPLSACPDSPNCERVSRGYDVPADTLFDAVQDALDALGPTASSADTDARRAHAVYRVALVFKDDVNVAVEPHDGGSVVHVRSASRVGYSDLGVNARRVERFFDAVDTAL